MLFIGEELRTHQLKELEHFWSTSDQDSSLQDDQEDPVQVKIYENKLSSLMYDVENVNDRETMSEIICQQPNGDDRLHCRSAEKWLKPGCNGSKQFITIVGQTQIGKTSILKNILRNAIKQYKYVFYISLKFVNCSDPLNFLEFLTKKTSGLSWIDWKCEDPCQASLDKTLFKKVVARITSKEQDHVCIVLDDFEKTKNFSHKENSSVTHCSYNEEATAGYFITRLLRNGFGNGQLLVLLNPWQFSYLKQKDVLQKNYTMIWVEGIDHKGQKHMRGSNQLGCQKDNCDLKDACFGFVTKNHTPQECSVCNLCHQNNCHFEIQSLCYVPSYCRFVKQKFKVNQQSSSTVIFAASVLIPKLRNQFRIYADDADGSYNGCDDERNYCDFERIGCFAWKTYLKSKFVFEEKELECLSPIEKNIFFSARNSETADAWYSSEDDHHLVFFFSHLLLQELLAALWLLSRCPDDFQIEFENHRALFSTKGKLSVVFEFMCEICKQNPIWRMCRKTDFWTISPQNYTWVVSKDIASTT